MSLFFGFFFFLSFYLPSAVICDLVVPARRVAAPRVLLALSAIAAAVVAVLWVRLHEGEAARRIHTGHEEAAGLLLESHLHGVAVLLHLELQVAARRICFLEKRDVDAVIDHLHAKAAKDRDVGVALIRVDKGARAMLLVMQIAAAVIALLLAHPIELARRHTVGRGVELLAQIDLVVNQALGALSFLERLLLLQHRLLSGAHLL